MSLDRIGVEHLDVLTFDIENRPLNYLGNDWTGAEITAIAWSWGDPNDVYSFLLDNEGKYWLTSPDGDMTMFDADQMLRRIRGLLASAHIVTGHYIRKHDLPHLNSAMIENRIEPLPTLLVCDTKEDFVKRKDISISQENLAAMFQLEEPKHHMTQSEWREANRLTREGLKKAHERVTKDVVQHMALRRELILHKLIRSPRQWKPFR